MNQVINLEQILDNYEVFILSTKRQEINRTEALDFITKARQRQVEEFNIARILSVKTNTGIVPVLNLTAKAA